jgi:hypothetical protein
MCLPVARDVSDRKPVNRYRLVSQTVAIESERYWQGSESSRTPPAGPPRHGRARDFSGGLHDARELLELGSRDTIARCVGAIASGELRRLLGAGCTQTRSLADRARGGPELEHNGLRIVAPWDRAVL